MKRFTWIYWIFGLFVFLFVIAQTLVYVVTKTGHILPEWLSITDTVCYYGEMVVFFSLAILWIFSTHMPIWAKIIVAFVVLMLILMILNCFPFLDKLWLKFE